MSSAASDMTEQQQREAKIQTMEMQCIMKKASRPTLDSLGVSGSIACLRSIPPPSPRKSRMSTTLWKSPRHASPVRIPMISSRSIRRMRNRSTRAMAT
eukprot:4346753-Prymnesium_polylepis.1